MAKVNHGGLMRVLCPVYLGPQRKFGSIEEQIFTIARGVKDLGGFFLPLFRHPPGPEAAAAYRAAGLHVEHLDLSDFSFTILSRLIRLVYRRRIQVIHWNFYAPFNWYYFALTMLSPGVKHYLTDHNSRDLPIRHSSGVLKKIAKKALFKRYRKVFAVSDFVLECLSVQGTWSNLCRWHHFVSTERFHPDGGMRIHIRKKLKAEKQFIALVVAHLIPSKGVAVAIKALIGLPEYIVLWVIGDGEERGYLQNLCKELSLDSRVTFLGLQVDVAPYMQAADCLVCPSTWAEAAGLVILEALASGLPVVASDVGGIPEFVEDGKNGLLFPAGDVEQLTERLRRVEGNPEAARGMALEARSSALRNFSLENRMGEYIDLYRA
jgi:glycosyltransferase involved in cell wall biosynthesis